ncbi:TPA: hypothetical protein JLU11_004843 [Escherichia coli]|nr:hypothetical protein [Escherichia coli]
MTIDLLGIYESKINGMNVKLYRDEDNGSLDLGRLVIDGSFKGFVPFYSTVQKMMRLEDKSYPVYNRSYIN